MYIRSRHSWLRVIDTPPPTRRFHDRQMLRSSGRDQDLGESKRHPATILMLSSHRHIPRFGLSQLPVNRERFLLSPRPSGSVHTVSPSQYRSRGFRVRHQHAQIGTTAAYSPNIILFSSMGISAYVLCSRREYGTVGFRHFLLFFKMRGGRFTRLGLAKLKGR